MNHPRLNFVFLTVVTIVAILFSSTSASAQVYTNTNYYYNNFDGGTIGTGFTAYGASTLGVTSSAASNNLAIESGYSLASTGTSGTGGYLMSFTTAGTNLSSQTYGYEWTFIYKNSGTNPDATNDWKYFLFAESNTPSTTKGYYLTQVGNTLQLRYQQDQYYSRTSMSFNLATIGGNNVTYAIRVQRLKEGKWVLYVDPYTSTTREAKTSRATCNEDETRTYNYSALTVLSNASGRFKFDELKMYSMELAITGANDASNGLSNPLYAGQTNAIIYGLQVSARGYFDFYQLKFNTSGNITQVIDANTVKLNKSSDSFFGSSDDVALVSMSCYDEYMQYFGSSSSPVGTFYGTGNADGTLGILAYYFVSANVKTSPTTGATYTFTGASTIQGSSTNTNYASSGSVSGTVTPPANSGAIYDWVGGNSANQAWSLSTNWSPAGVPGANDMARIGIYNYTYQPTVSTTTTVGNVTFGPAKSATLTINDGITLTVSGSITNQNTTAITGQVASSGTGALDVKGSILSGSTSSAAITLTSSIGSLTANNIVLNANYANSTIAGNSAAITIKNSLQTLSTTTNAGTYTISNNTALTLGGATAFSFAAGTAANNIFTLGTGSVEYNGASAQTVYTSTIPNSASAVSYADLKFSGAGTKTVQSGTLSISGNWNSATGKVDLTTNNTTVDFKGTTQTITDTGSDNGTGVVFKNVKFSGASGTKTLSTTGKFSVDATGLLTMFASGNVLKTNGNLRLKSSATSSAEVASIPSGASIIGNVTVERYVSGGPKKYFRSYRMLSSPVYDNSATLITADVTGNRTYKIAQLIDDMIVTGAGGTTTGFDASAQNQATAFTYNSNYVAVTTINTTVNVGRGMYVYYRGNRENLTAKMTSPFVDPESSILTFTGYLTQQTVSVPLTYATATNSSVGFNLLGNPYAATIDWNSANLVKENLVNNSIRIWNPANKQYATYDGTTGNNGGSRYIPAGQSFFVQAANGSGKITFTESAKTASNTQPETLVMSVANQGEHDPASDVVAVAPSILRLKLIKDETESVDESVIVMKAGSVSAYTNEDITHLNGEDVFLSTLSTDQQQLAINYVPEIKNLSYVALDASGTLSGNYTLKFNLENVPTGYAIQLKDRLLNSISNVSENFTYQVVINKADTASFGANRFLLMFTPPTVLPVKIKSFNAVKSAAGVLVKWETASELNNDHFEVERAGDNNTFVLLGTVDAKGAGTYSFADRSPLNGNNYYRLKQVDGDGKVTVFDPVQIRFGSNLSGISTSTIAVYPNPVVDQFLLKYSGELSSPTTVVSIVNPIGRTVLSKTITKEELTNGYSLNVSGQPTGVYFLELKDGLTNRKIGSSKVIKL